MLFVYMAKGGFGFSGMVATREAIVSDISGDCADEIGKEVYLGTGICATLTQTLALDVPSDASKDEMLAAVATVKPELVPALRRGFAGPDR